MALFCWKIKFEKTSGSVFSYLRLKSVKLVCKPCNRSNSTLLIIHINSQSVSVLYSCLVVFFTQLFHSKNQYDINVQAKL